MALPLALLLAGAAARAGAWPSADASCDGSSISISLSSGTLWGLPAPLGPPLTRTPTPPLTLRVASPLDGCTPPADPYTVSHLVLVSRGGCSFLQKAGAAHGAGAVAVVAEDAHCFAAGVPANATAAELAAAATTFTVDGATGARLFAASAVSGAAVTLADLSAGAERADPAAAVIALIATVCVAWGAFLVGRDEAGFGGHGATSENSGDDDDDSPAAPLSLDTPAAAACLVLGAATLLIIFALMPSIARFALTSLFLVGAGEAASVAVAAATKSLGARRTTASHIGVGVAAAGVATWLVLGPRVAWPLHDGLASCLLIGLIRALRVPSLRVATVLLSLAALNDAWWVFLQPRVFPSHESIMLSVASSTPALVLVAPGWRGGPHSFFALLGFGDVAIPGLAVAAAARWDAAKGQAPWTAGAGVLGYLVGLVATYAALLAHVGGGAGEPALVFLCPAVLTAIAIAAAVRKQTAALWRGLDAGEAGGGERLVV